MVQEAEVVEDETTEFEDAFDEFAGDDTGKEDDLEDPTKEGEAAAESTEELASNETKDGTQEDEPKEGDLYYGWPQAAIDAHKDQQSELETLQHRANSDSSRVSAFQRKVNTLEQQITEIQSSGTGDQPSDQEITTAMGSDEKWETFKEDYPEVAEAIDSRFENVIGAQNKQVQAAIAPVVERQAESEMEEAYDVVAQDFPTWQDAVQEQHFQDWLNTQPPGIQALANSDDTADASSLIGLYDGFRVEDGLETLKVVSNDPDNSGVEEDRPNSVAERRRRQLESGSAVPSKSARIDPTAETGDDFERAFNAFAQRKEAARQGA